MSISQRNGVQTKARCLIDFYRNIIASWGVVPLLALQKEGWQKKSVETDAMKVLYAIGSIEKKERNLEYTTSLATIAIIIFVLNV
mmetsp:Transcript_19067/g.41295  ORF Transcript_19067/g.41295 Transcript_19067/m.41295 type:complete len:85 (+) Transcript_19067:108-362(+)